jgi:hypothetical protein
MQVPTQPLVDSSALVDERVSVIDKQLHVPVGLLVRPGPAKGWFADRCPCDRERVDRV